MTWLLRHILLGFHITLSIIWVGGVLFIGWAVFPVAKRLQLSEQREFYRSLMKWTHWPLTLSGAGVIVTGILLGTVVGPIQHWQDVWHAIYGRIWAIALLVGLCTLMWGILVGYRKAMKVFNDDSLWQVEKPGNTMHLKKALRNIAIVESVEVAGFIILIICMLLFR